MANKRGRPFGNGLQDGWMLRRDANVLEAFDRARKSGLKHEAAIEAVVAELNAKFRAFRTCKKPKNLGMPFSASIVRRALAKFRPRDSQISYVARNASVEDLERETAQLQQLGVIGPHNKVTNSIILSIAPRPTYRN